MRAGSYWLLTLRTINIGYDNYLLFEDRNFLTILIWLSHKKSFENPKANAML